MKVMMKMIKAMRPRVFLPASKGVLGSNGLGCRIPIISVRNAQNNHPGQTNNPSNIRTITVNPARNLCLSPRSAYDICPPSS